MSAPGWDHEDEWFELGPVVGAPPDGDVFEALTSANAYRFKVATIEARRWSPDSGPDGDEWGAVETFTATGVARDGWGLWLRTGDVDGLLADGLWDVRIISEHIHRDACAFVA